MESDLKNFLKSLTGTLLLASAQTDDTDLLWLLSSEGFPFQSALMEGQSTICLDGRAWALDEVPSPKRLLRLYADSFGSRQPPLAVVQHAQISRYIHCDLSVLNDSSETTSLAFL